MRERRSGFDDQGRSAELEVVESSLSISSM